MNQRSVKNLQGVHPDLVSVIYRANELDPDSFVVIEGLRTHSRQAELFARKATRTMKSRHLTGHAVDLMALVNGEGRWDWPLYAELAKTVKEAARIEGVPITWGGDWTSFKDGPHFELPHNKYPE
jgi:peptidoglycan L-alanyl-D-glutamate endopeptidase CwlK